eukprot:GHUV01040467.1.p1 GENE.GHUV01040467.1~~GHUV01040467.1.p1  ORF type:complete len:115 (+),score=25.08 GHUV01040467.1:247-591(+)
MKLLLAAHESRILVAVCTGVWDGACCMCSSSNCSSHCRICYAGRWQTTAVGCALFLEVQVFICNSRIRPLTTLSWRRQLSLLLSCILLDVWDVDCRLQIVALSDGCTSAALSWR